MISKSFGQSIFDKWLSLADNRDLRKRYKEWITKSTTSGLTYDETVVSVEKYIVAKLQIQEKSAEIESKEPNYIVPIDSISNKGPFYEFDRSIEFENWKGKPFVKFFKSITPYNCTQCSGKGYSLCECENGLIQCRQCKGNTTSVCSNCSGKGTRGSKVQIIDGHSGKKRSTEMTYQCPSCFGAAVITCTNCSGLGKVGHSSCNYAGKLKCRICKGTGQIIDILEEPVPIKSAILEEYITGLKKEEEEQQVIEIMKSNKMNIHKLDLYKTNISLKDLSAVIDEPQKYHDKILKEINKQIKNKLKQKNEAIIEPIIIYIGWKLMCKSTKGHSFEVWCFGDSNNFDIVSIGL